MIKYKRILLKLSGESLQGNLQAGLDENVLMAYCQEVKQVVEMGVQVGIVIGGGNFFRGLKGAGRGFDRVKGDYMGMMATVMNALALQSFFESIGVKCRCFSAIKMEPAVEYYSKAKTLAALNQGEVVIFSFGTGNPYFTTDTAGVLRAIEMEAEIILKGTRVDGIYTADPEKDPSATRYDSLTFDEALSRNLKIMDLTAFALASENSLPILVFDMNREGNLRKVIAGEKTGTLVSC
jgi:uridylate kinase